MGRRDPDPRPTVELWGAEAHAAELPTRIQVGGRRSRRIPLLAAAAIVAVLAGGLALGGGDETSGGPREERDNRLRDDLKPPTVGGSTTTVPRSTSSSSLTTTTVVVGPVFPEQTGAALLLSDTSNQWTWLDLDTGERREVRMSVPDAYSLVPLTGGVVVLEGMSAVYQPLPEGEPVRLGRADQILSSGSSETVWLLQTNFDGPSIEGSDAVLVDRQGNERSGILHLPATYPAGGTARGLVFSRGGRTYIAEETGIRPLALGEALRSNGSSVVVLACNDQAECAPEIVDVTTGSTQRLSPIPNPFEMGISVLLSDAGDHLAIATYHGSGQSLQIYDRTGRTLGTIDDLSVKNEPRWLPNDLGLVAAVESGGGVVRISVGPDGLLVEPIAALEGEFGDFVYVIPR
ncbi:MAG: hypothetical protein ACRDZU_08290 [Acidimicrobiales bacterium]